MVMKGSQEVYRDVLYRSRVLEDTMCIGQQLVRCRIYENLKISNTLLRDKQVANKCSFSTHS